jgi:Domain of unknown function (DUF929)
MSKAQRIREMNARQRIAAQQAAARRAEARRRLFLTGGAIVAVIAVVVGIIVGKSISSHVSPTAPATATETSAVNQQITTVPARTLNTVGVGSGISPFQPIQGTPVALTASDGKPEMLYVGAEWCPYCGAERWAMVVALSRFGTFSHLNLIHSSSTDVYPNTPTLTFYKSTYTSKYLDFVSREWYTVDKKTLQTPDATEMALFSKYDTPPYVSSQYAGSFPFIDIGNKYVDIGAQYLPSVLAGLSWTEVATDMRNPTSTVAKNVDGAANVITAAICKADPKAPKSVCDSPAVKAGAKDL